jgi:hypothetical protein
MSAPWLKNHHREKPHHKNHSSKIEKSMFVDDVEIPHFKINPEAIMQLTSVFFGPSKTGKSTVIVDLLYNLRNKYPNVIVFSGMERQNPTFIHYVPLPCIFYSLRMDKLEELWKRQTMATEFYNLANDKDILKGMFIKCASHKDKAKVTQFIAQQNRTIKVIKKTFKEFSVVKTKVADVKNICGEHITEFWRDTIRQRKSILKKCKLSNDEKISLEYLDFNPHMLLIIDDLAAELKAMFSGKETKVLFKNIFYKGRHNYITTWLTFQDDSELVPEMRKNAFNVFFTSEECAGHYFTTKSNGVSKVKSKMAEKISQKIFKPIEGIRKNHNKFVFIREAPLHPFQYILADKHKNFKIGSDALHDICSKVKSEKTAVDKNSQFYKQFMDGIDDQPYMSNM